MASVYVETEVEIDIDDVLCKVSVADLQEELRSRVVEAGGPDFNTQVERVFLYYRHRTDAPDCVRALVYDVLGRVL